MSLPMRRSRENGYHRVEAFSDAVFAIVVTLIGYDLIEAGNSVGGTFLAQLKAAWPFYVAFGLSFLVVGQMWVVHHNIWQMIRAADQGLLVLNLGLLFFIAMLPWSAKLLATHLDGRTGDLRIAAALYAAAALGQACMFNLILWWARAKRLYDENMSEQRYKVIRARFLVGPIIYAAALMMVAISAYASIGIYLAVAVIYLGLGFFQPGDAGMPHAQAPTE